MSSSANTFYHYREAVLDWSVFYVVTAVASYVGIVVLALSIASGLFYLAELAEEYTTMTRRCLRVAIFVLMGVHALILCVDQISWWRSVLSIAAHAAYYQLLSTFPWVRLNSPVSNVAIAAFVLDNISWYSYFVAQSSEFPFWAIVSFFVSCVWVVPLGFFVSLAISEERIPTSFSVGMMDASNGSSGGKRKTLASFFAFVSGKKDSF